MSIPNAAVWAQLPGVPTRIDEVSTTVAYVGYAGSGVPDTNKNIWRIGRVLTSGTETSIEWAFGGAYTAAWDNRTTYFGAIPQTNDYSTDFDGVNDHATADHAGLIAALGTQYTVSAWVKFTSFASRCVLSMSHSSVANQHKIYLGVNASGNGRFEMRSDAGVLASITDTATMVAGTWNHICGIRNGSVVTMYVNGVANVSTSATMGTFTNNVVTLGVWKNGASFANYHLGRTDSVTIWNAAMTSAEVLALYNGGGAFDATSHSKAANLQAWWKMGDGDAFPTIYDHSGNNYHATMANMTSTDFVEDVP